MPDKIKEVFELISDKGYFSDENEFRSYVSDPKRRAEAFELIKDDGFFTDENEFNSYFGEVKKKEQAMPFDGQKFGGKEQEPLLPLTSSTVSPSALKQPKSTIPLESTGVKSKQASFKNVDISRPDLEVVGVKYDKVQERNRIQNYSQGLQKVQVDVAKRIKQRDELVAGVEELQFELQASKNNPEQYNSLIPQYNKLVNNVKLLTNDISSDFNKIDIFEKGIGVTELKRQINEDTVGNRALEGVNNAARILLEAAPATVQVASYLTQRSRGVDPITAEKVSVDIAEKGFPNIKRWSRELAEENEDLRSVFNKTTAWDLLTEKDSSLLEKDWAKIGELSAKELVQTLPATLAIMATYVNPIVGATTTIMGTAGMELEEMQGSNMTPDAKIANALTKGGLEYATEKVFGSIPMLKRAIGMKSKAGQEAYQNIVLETWNKFASKMGFAADVIEEVGSEVLNTIGGNYTDYLSGKTTEADLYKGLGETFTTSLTMASTLSGTGRAIKYGNRKINELREATKKLKEISNSQETTPEVLQVIQDKVVENNEKIAEEAKKEKKAFDSMDDRTFSEATTLVQEIQSLEQQLKNNEVPEDVIPLVEEKIKKGYEEIDELTKQTKETNIDPAEEASREVGNTENKIKVEELRAAEQAEKDATDPNDQEKLDEIYDRYNKLITPLLEDTKAIEEVVKEGKAQDKEQEVEVKEQITPEQIETGRQEISTVKEGKVNTSSPIRLFKGLFGKRNVDGTRKSAHPNAKGVFSAVDEKVAERYRGEDGMGTFDIPAGTTVEVVRLENKNIPVSKFREQETEAINASDAQIVKLITLDAKGAEEQYVIKDPALIEKMQKPEDVKQTKEQEDAVQEQTAEQVPVQPEAKVGEGVEGGKPQAEPKEATEESKAEEVEKQIDAIFNPDFKNTIVDKLSKFDKQIADKKFPSALEVAEHVLPRSIFNKYKKLYELAARNNITVSNEKLPSGMAAAWAFGNIQLDKNIAKYYLSDYNEFAETLNHEIIHGLISIGIRDNYALNKNLKDVMSQVLDRFDSASDEVKNIISYIQDTSKEFTETNFETSEKTGSLEELITYAFTNKEFADFLDSIPASKKINVKGKSIFQQLKNIIRDFISKKTRTATALDEINSVVDKYFDTSYNENDIAERNAKYEWGLKFKANESIFDKYNNDPKLISEAYYKGDNPKLNKAVNELLGFKKVGENKYEYNPKVEDSSGDIGSRTDDSGAKKSDIAAGTNKKQSSKNVDSAEEGQSEVDKETEVDKEATEEKKEEVAKKAGISPKNIRDLYNINRELFGLDRVKSLASAVAMDRMVGAMAKRAGVTKAEMYGKLKFEKASEKKLPQGVKMQLDYENELEKIKNDAIKNNNFMKAPNGKPSNLTEKQWLQVRTKSFKDWFGDWQNSPNSASKVIDENGEPLVVYHGSSYGNIEIFDREQSNKKSSRLKEFGDYFTTNKALADFYRKYGAKNLKNDFLKEIDRDIRILQEKQDLVKNNRDFNAIEEEINRLKSLKDGKTYEVFLNLRKIKEFDAKGKEEMSAWRELEVDAGYKIASNRDAMEFLKEGKFGVEKVNGVLAKNIVDAFVQGNEKLRNELIGDVYLVFEGQENAIKSASENIGSFSSVNKNIKFQNDANKARGAVMVTLDGQAVIYALTDPNVSTPLHELAHVFEHYLTDAEKSAVMKAAGTKEWNIQTSEYFARGFEKYLAEGKSPIPALDKLFAKFKEWLTEIYNGIKGSDIDIKLNKPMRDIYASMLGEKIEGVKFPDNISKIAKELNLSPQQIQNTYKKYDGSKKIEDITLEDYNKARAEGNKAKIENSKKAFEALLKEDSVSPTAKKKVAELKKEAGKETVKEAGEIMDNIDSIRQQLLDAGVIKSINCKWG